MRGEMSERRSYRPASWRYARSSSTDPRTRRWSAFAPDWPGWSRGAKTADDALAALELYRSRYRAHRGQGATRQRVRRAGRPQGGRREGRHRIDRLLGHLVFTVPTRDRTNGRRRLHAEGQAAAIVLVLLRRRGCSRVAHDGQGTARRRTRARPHHRPHHSGRERGFRQEGGPAHSARDGLERGRTRRLPRRLRGGDGRVPKKGEVKPMGSWNLPFLIRHSAFHTMDHAWEMEDKDLSGKNDAPR